MFYTDADGSKRDVSRDAAVDQALKLVAATLQYSAMTVEEGFEAFDADEDDGISIEDLCSVAADLNMELSKEQLAHLHAYLDQDGDGLVSLQVR